MHVEKFQILKFIVFDLGNENVTDLLLKNGAHANDTNENGNSPLFYAASNGTILVINNRLHLSTIYILCFV